MKEEGISTYPRACAGKCTEPRWAFWALSSGRITGLLLCRDAILPGGVVGVGWWGYAQVTAVWQSAELRKLPLLSRLGQRVTQVNRKGCHSKLTSHKPAHTAGFWSPGSHEQPAARREESDLPWGRLEVKTRVDRSCHLWPPTVKWSTAFITSFINGLSVCFLVQQKAA